MSLWKFRIGDETPTLLYAKRALIDVGWEYCDTGKYLLLPIPTRSDYSHLVNKDTIVIGGNLSHPCPCIDLLQDPFYLAENARITAYCAIKYAIANLPVTIYDCDMLILGWGRIGKCLSQLLRNLGANVTVYARKPVDRAALASLGYNTTNHLEDVQQYRVIFNTAPTPLVPASALAPEQVKIDLASSRGIDGEDVIWARGLPGRDAPETSGKLIAKTIHRLRKEGIL